MTAICQNRVQLRDTIGHYVGVNALKIPAFTGSERP